MTTGDDTEDPLTSAPKHRPIASLIACGWCIAVFAGLHWVGDTDRMESLSRWGYTSPTAMWNGAVWGYLTSVFVHEALWHLAFNVYWLGVLGYTIEREMGSLRFFALFATAAWISSGFEFLASGTVGIGASGVGYGMFGFMWFARSSVPAYAAIVTPRLVALFLGWGALCVVATLTGTWSVGNAAHISGLLLGMLGATFAYGKRRIAGLLIVVLLAVATLPIVWLPWSEHWQGHRAYRYQITGQRAEAIESYTRVIELNPESAWAYFNRGIALEEAGQTAAAEEDYAKAQDLDSSYQR